MMSGREGTENRPLFPKERNNSEKINCIGFNGHNIGQF